LWFRPAQRDKAGRITHAAAWFILDRDSRRRRQIPTGTDSKDEAEKCFAAYLAEKHSASAASVKDPDRILVADVISVYAKDVVPRHSSPVASKHRLTRLLDFFGAMRLSDINGQVCRRYFQQSTTDAMARRDLEELKAAINHHRKEGLHDRIISVWLPPTRPPRERWLSVEEAARLLRSAWRRPKCKHIARFILVGLYTGRRASVIASASFQREPGRSFIDLRTGMLFPPERVRQTRKRNPATPLPKSLLAHFRRWHRNGQRYAVEWSGRPVSRIQTMKQIAIEAGLGNDITPHVLRHTAASWMMQSGEDLAQISAYLGMTVATLLSTYGHLRPEHLSGVKDYRTRHRQQVVNTSREPKENKVA